MKVIIRNVIINKQNLENAVLQNLINDINSKKIEQNLHSFLRNLLC